MPLAPVNIISGGPSPLHTAVVPLTVAVGSGLTTTTAESSIDWIQAVELES